MDVWDDLRTAYAASVADDKLDEDGDGIADVKQLSSNDLFWRKVSVSAQAIKDPEKLAVALGGLYTSWLAVQGVLRLEFAKTITLGVSIATMVTPMLQRICVPFFAHVLPKQYHHWIPLTIKVGARTIGVALAWRVQVLVSALHLALYGGLLCSRSLLRFAQRRGHLANLQEDDTYADEIVGYAIAGCGFYTQLSQGFCMPFPLNIVFLPFTWIEWYIRYSITTDAPVA
jgi:hypothetical protein